MPRVRAQGLGNRRAPALLGLLVLVGAGLGVLASPAAAATATWDGGGGDLDWSTGANWVGDAPPVADDDLVFPALPPSSPNNDFAPGTAFASISFTGAGGDYDLVGDVVVTNAVTAVNTIGTNTVSVPLKLSGPGTFTSTNGGGKLAYSSVNIGANNLEFAGNGVHMVNGAITGSGTLTKSGGGLLSLFGDAIGQTWTSTVTGGALAVLGNQPANVVTLNGGELHGLGTTGSIVGTAGGIRPGGPAAGTLTVDGNMVLTGAVTYHVQLNGLLPGTQFDQLFVKGVVDLGGAALALAPGFLPPPNTEFVIIANDLSDPVSGTFAGLADGATFTSGPGSRTYRVDYSGGDGNDVSLTRLDEVWDGGGGDADWSTGANWLDDSAPTVDDSLVFDDASGGVLTNGIAADTQFASITYATAQWWVTGNGIRLTDGIVMSLSGGVLAVTHGLPTTVTADQEWRVTDACCGLIVSGPVTLQGGTLTLDGPGSFNFDGTITSTLDGLVKNGSGSAILTADNDVSGPTTVNNGALVVTGDLSEGPVTVPGGVLMGTGTVGNVRVTGGTIEGGASPGTLTVLGDLEMPAGVFRAELGGTGPGTGTETGTGYDQVRVGGALDLGGAALDLVPLSGFTPSPGDSFTLVDRDAGLSTPGGQASAPASATTGVFASLPEGATFTEDGATFTITYQGGDGDDVVITAQGDTPTTTTAPPATTTTTAPPATTTTTTPPATTTTTGGGGGLPTTGSGEGTLVGARLGALAVAAGSLLMVAAWTGRRRIRRFRRARA